MTSEIVRIIVGNIIHCSKQYEINTIEKGFIMVLGNKILAVDNELALEEVKSRLNLTDHETEKIVLKESQILIPGLIDTHIHAPQYPNCGLGYDKPLLEWLDIYTYKLEKRYRNQEFAKKVFNAVVRKTLDHGTTTACYFASLFENSSIALVDAAIKHGQRAFVGKINMTTLAPDDYIETPSESIKTTKKFIEDVKAKKNDLVQPIITPRFALSVDMDLMKELGKIAKEQDLHIQTHICENLDEIRLVKEKYNLLYAKVYDEANLLTSKTVLAHGIYLTEDELKLLAQRGTSVSHCPESNTCLKSGLCDVKKLIAAGVKVGLGTDVSGGPSPSIVSAMKAALDTSVHISFNKENYTPMTYADVFYLATLGGAEALALEDKTGNFEAGKDFDALIIDMDIENSSVDYLLGCKPDEILQKFIYFGDDRNVLNVFVAGKRVK
ncbi:hypothetical protein NQ314_000956 [Rhamnusium bicolor]|uniref:Guanine deaminase n=1 Tax=Rhamnusium bicolor TaxID=1586634 RepID=A0AAV8ZUQ3_9CUCU|nr:hypothetical protein NQ314_000956 [Rhamnusium bicolor]